MSHFNRFYPRASSSQGIAPMFRMHQQPRVNPNVRHEGFRSLNELLHPKLRPKIHIISVEKLIRYHFARLKLMIHIMVRRQKECTVYLPWSQSGWAFAIFKPGPDVARLMTSLALELEDAFAGRQDVHFVKNIWNAQDPNTDYNYLVKKFENILLVFGDNTTGKGKGGTAAVRDYPNAFGIPTGWSDSYGVWSAEKEKDYWYSHYLDYEIEEYLDRREFRRKHHYDDLRKQLDEEKYEIQQEHQANIAKMAQLEEREKELRAREMALQQRDLALRQQETMISQREARAQRRMSKKN